MAETVTPPRRGGFSLPKNPGRALQELLAEERAGLPLTELPLTEAPSPTLDLPSEAEGDAQMRNGADAQLLEQAREHVSNQASAAAIEEAPKQLRTRSREHSSKPVSNHAITPVSESVSKSALAETVRTKLADKRSHPGGTKASVDMSPELSLRAKRYLLDHGNPPLRILMLELLTAFLDEEEY